MAKRRNITDPRLLTEYILNCRSRACEYTCDSDENGCHGGIIYITTRYKNVPQKDVTVYVRANSDSDEWVLPRFKITKLRAGDKIYLTGMLRGYDAQSRHGASFYLGSKIYLEQRNLE